MEGTTVLEKGNTGFVKRTLLKAFVALIIIVAYSLFGLLAASLFGNIAKPYQVPSSSMLPAIMPNDRIVVNRLNYGSSLPERGEIIVFRRINEETTYIKRVIGLPGDIVEVRNGQVYVNNDEFKVTGAGIASYKIPADTVPNGMLYVLGDNRDESADSHIWGPISSDEVIGRAEYVYWPLNHWTLLSSNFVFSDLLFPISILLSFLLTPIICAVVAVKRKRSSIGWFLLGILGVIPLIIIVLLPEKAQIQEPHSPNN